MLALEKAAEPPPASQARRTTSYRFIPQATKITRSASGPALSAQGPTSSVPHRNRTQHEEHSAPLLSAQSAFFMRSFAKERNPTPLFSIKGTLFSAPQAMHLQSVAHSFIAKKFITPFFPVVSALFVRSFAKERKLSLLFSYACALFREKCRACGRKTEISLNYYFNLFPIRDGLAPSQSPSQDFGHLVLSCRINQFGLYSAP
jgi:hypothetical protein